MRHTVKKRVTGLSFTTGLVSRISHDEEVAQRSLKPSINSMSPSLVQFIGVLKGKKDLCQTVRERHTLCLGIFLIKTNVCSLRLHLKLMFSMPDDTRDNDFHIKTNHYIMYAEAGVLLLQTVLVQKRIFYCCVN